MSTTTNYPSATPQSQPPKKDFKNLVIGLLAGRFSRHLGLFTLEQ